MYHDKGSMSVNEKIKELNWLIRSNKTLCLIIQFTVLLNESNILIET